MARVGLNEGGKFTSASIRKQPKRGKDYSWTNVTLKRGSRRDRKGTGLCRRERGKKTSSFPLRRRKKKRGVGEKESEGKQF